MALNIKPIKSSPTVASTRSPNDSRLEEINQAISEIPYHLIESMEDVTDRFYVFSKLTLDAIDRISPVKNKRVKNNNHPWFDIELRELFSRRDR